MPQRHVPSAALALTFLLLLAAPAGAQEDTPFLKQLHEGTAATSLTAAELAALSGDPFFDLVLEPGGRVDSLEEVERRLAPPGSGIKEELFVVHERIVSPRPGARRAVIAFKGRHPSGHMLTRNVMLSVFFDSERFAERSVEAWGWDNHRGRYNYYRLDRSGTPDRRLSWKFRGSSEGADLLQPEDRSGTCLACHVNGAPIMKELLIPWNNWHSFRFLAGYLSPSAPDERRWPIASHPRMGFLTGAEVLETDHLLDAIRHFNARRVNDVLEREDDRRAIRVDAEGFARVLEGRRTLKPLFVTTEVNLISADQLSGLDAFPPAGDTSPSSTPIRVPNSFFLNAGLIGGRERGQLQILTANEFSGAAVLDPALYRELVREHDLQLSGVRGDAHFAWFVPEASHIDNDLVSRLLREGVVSARFVAAALAVDLRQPIFSGARASLWERFVPETFRFRPLAPTDDPLERDLALVDLPGDALIPSVIAAIEETEPADGTPEALFLERLRSDDPLRALEADVDAYLAEIRSEKQADERSFAARLFQDLLERRRAMLRDPVLSTLDESRGGLLPLPPPLPTPAGVPTEGHRGREEGGER